MNLNAWSTGNRNADVGCWPEADVLIVAVHLRLCEKTDVHRGCMQIADCSPPAVSNPSLNSFELSL